MKKSRITILCLILSICALVMIPASSYAVQVKTDNGRIASSVEAESDQTLTPVYPDQIAEGTYPVTVRSSSSMFRVTDCQLTVAGGKMTADMTLSGTAYLKLYMGTEEEAASAEETACIPYTENEYGAYTYKVPVEALNKETDCAAFSGRSNRWFPRTLVFESSSLPEGVIATVTEDPSQEGAGSAASDGQENTPASAVKESWPKAADAKSSRIHYAPVSLADGDYTIPVTLSGGSGKSSISSPTDMTVKNSHATARIQWSSPHYDYMVVDGLLYEPVNEEGNSVFEIPVTEFDDGMKVIADTTAMSQPYEIEYTLHFDASKAERLGMSVRTKGILLLVIILAVIIAGFIRGRLRSGKVKYDEMNDQAELERLASARPVSRKKKKLR